MATKKTIGSKQNVLDLGSFPLKHLGVGVLSPRSFSTGSVGYNHSGKVNIKCPDPKSFQVSLNITMSHSKPGDLKQVPKEVIQNFLDSNPVTLNDLGLSEAMADARLFSSGKVGFYFNGKVNVQGRSFQIGCSITAVGSETWAETNDVSVADLM